MKNKKEISSPKGLRANGQSYLIQTFCPYRDRKEGMYQKTSLTAKFAKKSQRPQRGNYPFIKMLPTLHPRCILCSYLESLTFVQHPHVIFRLMESNPGLFETGAASVRKMELFPVLATHFRYLFPWEGSPEPDSIGVWRRLLQSVSKVEWKTFSSKLPFFTRIRPRDRKILRGFSPESRIKIVRTYLNVNLFRASGGGKEQSLEPRRRVYGTDQGSMLLWI